jgi:hypothetical protein
LTCAVPALHGSQYLHEAQSCSGSDIPPHLQPLYRRHHHLRHFRHSMIPPRPSKTLSCRFDRYERTRPTRNTTFSLSFLKMTIPPPLLRRKRRALTGGGPRNDLRDIAVARSRRFRSPQRCSFAPLFSDIFTFLGKKVVYPPANLGASQFGRQQQKIQSR